MLDYGKMPTDSGDHPLSPPLASADVAPSVSPGAIAESAFTPPQGENVDTSQPAAVVEPEAATTKRGTRGRGSKRGVPTPEPTTTTTSTPLQAPALYVHVEPNQPVETPPWEYPMGLTTGAKWNLGGHAFVLSGIHANGDIVFTPLYVEVG